VSIRARLTLASLLAALAVAGPASAAPTTPVSQEGRWIVDADGRVVLMRGVNMVYKVPPYHPGAAGFGIDDARFLAREGFNTVRLGIIYAGVEPSPGVYDEAYLDQIGATAHALASEGIFFQLDFHQDMYNERFQGEGWPDWAVYDDGLPAEPKNGFPANYFGMPALIRAFDNWWANVQGPGGYGLQDSYAAAWRHVAERFKDEPYLMGYDLLNEPWPGTPWLTCANNVGCPAFDTQTLTPFSRLVTDRIREVDQRNIVWYEPNVLFNNGPETYHGDVAGEAGMSFHVYCLEEGANSPDTDPGQNALEEETCRLREDLPFENASEHAVQTGNALLLSEFGASDDLGEIERIIRRAERSLISWQYWHYCNCEDPTTSGSGGKQSVVNEASQPPSGENLKVGKLEVLARPNPQAVAGTPTLWRFDRPTGAFELDYSTERASGGSFDPSAETEVFIPERHYTRGYDVEVKGGEPVSAPNERVLRVRACSGRAEVQIRVRPGAGTATADCLAPETAAGRRAPRLRLRVRPRAVRAGRLVRFRFRAFARNSARRVYVLGARIRFAGERTRTKRAGRAAIRARLQRPGRHRARVRKRGMRSGRALVRVRPAR